MEPLSRPSSEISGGRKNTEKVRRGNVRQCTKISRKLGGETSSRCRDTRYLKAWRHQACQGYNHKGGAEHSSVETPGNDWRGDIGQAWKNLAMEGVETQRRSGMETPGMSDLET